MGRGHRLHVTADNTAGTAVSLLAGGVVDVVETAAGELPRLFAAGLRPALADRPDDAPNPTVVALSSGPLDADVAWDLQHSPVAAVRFVYGPPECAFAATATPAGDNRGRPNIGVALANMSAQVRDRSGRAMPVGAAGELHLGGPSVASRYRDRPGRHAGRFGPDAGRRGRSWASGQRARLRPDGNLELLAGPGGTADVDGCAVEPARIQAALADCADVAAVAVVARHDLPGRRRLVAYVVAAPGRPAPSLAQLRAHLWARLPGYAWPAAAVAVDWLPDHPGGGDPARLPPPAHDNDNRDASSPEEAALSALWAAGGGDTDEDRGGNYWQSFSFLDALTAARRHGMAVDAAMVSRNRNTQTLAADLAATGRGRGPATP